MTKFQMATEPTKPTTAPVSPETVTPTSGEKPEDPKAKDAVTVIESK